MRIYVYPLFFFAYFNFSFVEAKTHFLFFAGYSDKATRNEAQKSIDDARRGGAEVFLAASLGEWKNVPNSQRFGAKTEKEFEQAVTEAVKNISSTDTLVIDFVGHGGGPEGFSKPSSGGPGFESLNPLRADILTYDQIQNVLSKLPKHANIKLAGFQCYGGGMHEISFNLPNVCSVSSSDFRSVTVGNNFKGWGEGLFPGASVLRERTQIREVSVYHRSLLSSYGDKKGGNLIELHQAAALDDTINRGAVRSSAAFLQKVLKEEAYDSNFKSNIGLTNFVTKFNYIVDSPIAFMTGGFKDISMPTPYTLAAAHPYIQCKDIDNLKKWTEDIASLVKEVEKNNSIENLPLNPLYKKLILSSQAEVKNNYASIKKLLQRHEDQFHDLQIRWNQLSPTEQDAQRIKYREKFRELDESLRKGILPFWNSFRWASEGQQLSRFYGQATAEQKKTFERLIECESSQF